MKTHGARRLRGSSRSASAVRVVIGTVRIRPCLGGPNTPRMMQPRYAADSRHVVFLSEQTGFRHVHVLDPLYESQRPLTPQMALSCGEPSLAEQVLREGLLLAPGDPGLHHDLAISLRESGDPELALTSMKRAAGLAPDRADILNNLGGLHERLGQLDEALGAYRRASGDAACQ